MPAAGEKQRRTTYACDFCHKRGIRCKEGTPASCLSCIEYGQECTRNRQPRKRGTKPKARPTQEGNSRSAELPPSDAQPSTLPDLGSRKIVTALLDIYLDTVHPSFPLFCEREIWVGWRDGSFPNGPSDYMSLMCMCALSSQHAGSGALFTDDIVHSDSATLAHKYLQEAVRLVPVDFEQLDANLIRSYGFLALSGAQSGNSIMVHKYLGLYHGACAQFNLFDESRWSTDISECEREMRRRLWWAMYRLEVHTACVLGNPVRSSEVLCNVGYPCGLHHEAFIPGRDGDFEDWFSGWNSTTDLYRVLEHAIADFRTRRGRRNSILGDPGRATTASIVEKLATIQHKLLPQFGMASTRSSDSGRNRCGFQAANILCTIHLARMISSISGENSLHTACETANGMMTSMKTIPFEYLRAIGSPLIQQLAGVGHILIGVANKQRLPTTQYIPLRDVLTSIITFISRLKEYNNTAATAHHRLAAQLADLDTQMSISPPDVPINGGTASEDGEIFSWSPYLDQIFFDPNSNGDVFSANLHNFTWQ